MNEQPGKEGRSDGRGRDSDNFIVQAGAEAWKGSYRLSIKSRTHALHTGVDNVWKQDWQE